MPTTPQGLRYPGSSDPPNGPLQIAELAADVDAQLTELAADMAVSSERLLAYKEVSANQGTSGTAEARITGGPNITAVTLSVGRAYEAVAAGHLNATGGTGLIRLRLRAALGATPTTTNSTVVGGTQKYISITGGPGQVSFTTAGQPFQVNAAGSYQIHAFGAVVDGSATSMLMVPDGRGVHSIAVYDRGTAVSGLRTI